MKFLTPPTQRLVAGLALLGAFLVMASVFVPLDSGAVEPIPLTPHQPQHHAQDALRGVHPGDVPFGDPPSVDPHAGLRSIGSLEHGEYRIVIYATEGGPRFSIWDRKTGEELATLFTAERVHDFFPELPLPDIDYSAPAPVQMMAAPPDARDF